MSQRCHGSLIVICPSQREIEPSPRRGRVGIIEGGVAPGGTIGFPDANVGIEGVVVEHIKRESLNPAHLGVLAAGNEFDSISMVENSICGITKDSAERLTDLQSDEAT